MKRIGRLGLAMAQTACTNIRDLQQKTLGL